MGLLKLFSRWRPGARHVPNLRTRDSEDRGRFCRFERMEPRQLLSATPLYIGAVYFEDDAGGDDIGDRFEIAFLGGAPDTQVTRLVLDGNIDGSTDASGHATLTFGDVFFDTAAGGEGADGHSAFHLGSGSQGIGPGDVIATVQDGGTRLELELTNFVVGDKLVFIIDVDEVEHRNSDPITSGVEFELVTLEATAVDPYHTFEVISAFDGTGHGQATFWNEYDPILGPTGLLQVLPEDNAQGKRDRSAGAVLGLQPIPKPISISGTVYHDHDANDRQDAGDEGLRDVTLSLLKKVDGQFIATGHSTTTDANGHYRFGEDLGLTPGVYQVREAQPGAFFSLNALPGTVGPRTGPQAATGTFADTNTISEINIPTGNFHGVGYDFSEGKGSLGGFVYYDRDNGGTREPGTGESGIGGVTLRLLGSNGAVVGQTVTLADGSYRFDNLAPDTYSIVEVHPTAWIDGRDTAGTIGTASRGTPVNPGDMIQFVALTQTDLGRSHPERSGVNYNFGERQGSIAGRVHVDGGVDESTGPNCVFDAGDTPLAGVRIELLNEQGNVVRTTTTDAQGQYRFDDLPVGVYSVREIQPVSYFHGGQTAGSGSGNASQANLISGIRVDGNEFQLTDYNFCETGGMLGGFVYHDRDNDGQREPQNGEAGIAGVTVILLDSNGREVARQQTAADGSYKFNDLPADVYAIVELQPEAWIDGRDTPGTINGTQMGNATVRNDELRQINLHWTSPSEPMQNGINYNFGERLASLSGRVHVDGGIDPSRQHNCVFDEGETVLAGVTMELLDANGTVVATTTTDAQGIYRFDDLERGVYSVRQLQPRDYFQGGQAVGNGSGDASQANLISGIRVDEGIDLALTDYNFCEALGSLGGFVYHDRDNDGQRETASSEQGIAGVTVLLLDSTGREVARQQTASDGSYTFHDLKADVYTVVELQPTAWVDGRDTAGTIGGQQIGDTTVRNDEIHQVNLRWQSPTEAARNGVNYNFGERLASIAGRVHVDGGIDPSRQHDCVFDEGETVLAGVTMELLNEGGNVIGTTQTDSNGLYRFDQLERGVYSVRQVQPRDYFQGGQRAGNGSGDASRANLISGININSTDDVVLDGYNFCETTGMLGGFVYHDRDNDAARESQAGELGISGVTIILYDSRGHEVARQQTAADGSYKFNDLKADVYKIVEVQPRQWIDGRETPGTIGGRPSGTTTVDDQILAIDLTWTDPTQGMQNGTDYNFGERLGSITGYVHSSPTPDCVTPQNSTPLAGVAITLVDQDGHEFTTTTDRTGRYQFTGLAPGRYTLQEAQPSGLFQGGQVAGNGGGDASVTDVISGIQLGSQQADVTGYNFCEVPPARLSGYVFRDGAPIETLDGQPPANIASLRDGRFTPYRDGDQPLAGVTVALRRGIDGGLLKASQLLFEHPGAVGSTITVPTAAGFQQITKVAVTGAGGAPEIRYLVTTSTNASGFYEFVGLRGGSSNDGTEGFGNYAVWQMDLNQGNAVYYDGVDTVGTTTGFADNRHLLEPASGSGPTVSIGVGPNFAAHTLQGARSGDLIVRIALAAGTSSELNNFSEVQVTPAVLCFPGDPSCSPRVTPPPAEPFREPPAPPPKPPLVMVPPAEEQPFRFFGVPLGYTWHLSVLDAGQPRGDEQAENEEKSETEEVPVWYTSNYLRSVKWTADSLREGTWTILRFDEGEQEDIEESIEFVFGIEGGTPVTGDFNGDGVSEIAIFYKGEWFIDLNGNGRWDHGDLWAELGDASDLPVTGDWDGDGKDDIGIFGPEWPGDPRAVENEPGLPDPDNPPKNKPKNIPPYTEEATDGVRVLKLTEDGRPRADLIDHVFRYGIPEDRPVAGDWNGDGIDAIGVFRDGVWWLDMDGDGQLTERDQVAHFGQAGDRPVVGDFDGNGVDDLGVYRGGRWYLDGNGNRKIDAHDRVFEQGGADDEPTVGDWDGDGVDEPGLYRPGARSAPLQARLEKG